MKYTQYFFTGDLEKCYTLLKRAEIVAGQMKDSRMLSGVQSLCRRVVTQDGDILVAQHFNRTEIWINGTLPEQKPQAQIGEDMFVVVYLRGYEQYVPVGAPAGQYDPMVITPWYAIVYDPNTKAYAKITDPKPEDADDDGNIKFPCPAEKIQDWFYSIGWVSKKDMSATGRTTSDNWKVWDEQFSFSEVINGYTYVWGPDKAGDYNKPVDCGCHSYPTNYSQLPCFYELSWSDNDNIWICMTPFVEDDGGSDYRYIVSPAGDALLSLYSCYSGGFCKFTGNAGYGGSWSYSGELTKNGANDTVVSITPGSIPGTSLDYNALGVDYFGAAKLTCSYNKNIISSYEHERNQTDETDASASGSSQYTMDWNDVVIIGSTPYHALHHVEQWLKPRKYDYLVANSIHTPIGSKDSVEEKTSLTSTDKGTYETKSYGTYVHSDEYLVTDTRSYDASRSDSFIPDITKGDYNVFNCYRVNFSLTTQEQEVLVQFYMWHYFLENTTDETHGRTANTGVTTHTLTHSWGHTFIGQAEIPNKKKPNPMIQTDYKKSADTGDFVFNTPEFESELEDLIKKVYGERKYPLILEFDPYIVSTAVDADGNPTDATA